MLLIMTFEFLISLTDVYIAGTIEKKYQAAVGFTSQFYFIFIVFANALTIGTVSVLSRQFTANESNLPNNIFSIVITTIVSGLFLSISGVVLTAFIVPLTNIPISIKPISINLLQLYAAGLMFHFLLINTNGILRACGNIKKSLVTMALVCILNIGLNFYLVYHTTWGYKGIALSTIISLAIGSIINLYFTYPLLKGFNRYIINTVKKVISIGWPSGILQISWQLGGTVLFLIISLLPAHQVEIMAAFTNGLRIESAIFLPAFAFNMANSVVIGNLLGKKEYKEAFTTGLITAFLAVIFILVLTVIVIVNAPLLTSFLTTNAIVKNETLKYLYIVMLSEPFMAWAVVLGGGLNGAGDTRGVTKIVVLSLWLVRIPLSYFLGIHLQYGAVAMYWSMNMSIFIHTIFLTRRYIKAEWLSIKV